MLHRSAILTLLILASANAVHARGNLKELTVPLKFATQEAVHSSTPDLLPAMTSTNVALRVEDGRKLDDALLIGHGTGGDDKTFPIHADRSVTAFVEESLRSTAKDWGLSLASPAARTLILQLTRFDIDESNKALGSVYAAEVKLAFTLKDSAGHVLAEGAVSGSAHRYGHAHSPENCNEVLSDALQEAFSNVLSDSDLQHAWASGKRTSGSSSSSQQTAPAATPEERLRKLDDLLKKGLITKEEYQQKRAEILKEM